MTSSPRHNIPIELIQAMRSASAITVLTGAGISAESGIPTFRESQTGLWAQYDPQELATPGAFARNPALVIEWYRWRYNLVCQAQPNPGHFALAEMERNAPGFTLITQNVDGLHARAGSTRLVELHGSLSRVRCSDPACQVQMDQWPEGENPLCPRCGAALRPDVVWFSEPLPVSSFNEALQAARACDLFFSIGTSGVVEPAGSLPYEALRGGALVVEINPQPTPLSVHTRFYFPEPAGQILPRIVSAAWPGR